MYGMARSVTESPDVYLSTCTIECDSTGGQASDQPSVAGRDVMILSLSLLLGTSATSVIRVSSHVRTCACCHDS